MLSAKETNRLNLAYEQPKLIKYGTIKALTFGTSGSTASNDLLGFGGALGIDEQEYSDLVDALFDEENV